MTFVGLENFARLLTSRDYHRSIVNSFIFGWNQYLWPLSLWCGRELRWENTMRLRQLHSTVKLGGLLSARQVSAGRLISALLDALETLPGQLIGVQHTLLTAPVVASVRQRGLTLAAPTVNDAATMQRVVNLGIEISS